MRPLAAAALALALLTAVAASGCRGGGGGAVAPPLPTLGPTSDSGPTAANTSEAPTDPAAVTIPCGERQAAGDALTGAVTAALEGYAGTWGFALIDLECDAMFVVNPEYVQYPASSSKILSIVAAMRGVDEGRIDFEDVDPIIREVFFSSSDAHADQLDTFLGPEELSDALHAVEGITEASTVEDEWRYTHMTAPDLARFWAAIVEGRLLTEESTDYVLELAQTLDIPDGLETFPDTHFELDGYEFGQKAGYYVIDGVPYDLVGSGFLRPVDESWPGIVAVILLHTTNPAFLDPQRREVFPLVLEYVDAVTEGELPEATNLP